MAKDFTAGNQTAELNKAHTRTGIMLVIAPVVAAALASIAGLDLTENVAHIRRAVRALATLSVKMALDAGASPMNASNMLQEALAHEWAERQAKANNEAKALQADAPEQTLTGGKVRKDLAPCVYGMRKTPTRI